MMSEIPAKIARISKGITVLAGCLLFACHHDYQPPWPPDLNPLVYVERSADLQIGAVRVGGARLANEGLYVDLVCHVNEDPDSAVQTLGRVGRHLSLLSNPAEVIELRDESNHAMILRPMRQPSSPGLFAMVSWLPLPTYVLGSNDAGTRAVQVCMWRTKGQLAPGRYKMRLTGWPTSQMTAVTDDSWNEVQIDWAK